MGIGARIKAERERLGFTQPAFAGLGASSKNSQIAWEKESAFPNAAVRAAWAAQGADVLYILTGERSATALSPEEQTLLAYYRDAPAAVRRAAMGALVGGAQPGGMTMTQSGGGVQVGHSSGPVTVGAPAPRKRKTG